MTLFFGVRGRAALRQYGYLLCLLPIIAAGSYCSVAYRMVNQAPGETGSAALGWLQTGSISNPYLVPTGPTAHVAPGTAALLAAVYSLFGGNSPVARVVLSLMATVEYALSVWLVLVICAALRLNRVGIAAAILLGCLFPVHLYDDVVNYRQWDQPTSAVFLTALLLVWIRFGIVGSCWIRPSLMLGALGGIGSLFAPALPLVAVVAAVALALRQRNWRIATVVVLLVLVGMIPWALRNQSALGSLVLTRSNYGLELAAGNHDAATGTFDLNAMPPIHPHDHPVAVDRLAMIGEVAYMAEMKAQALTWIRGHPERFVELCLHRARLLFFPDQAGGDPLFRWLKLPLLWAVSALATLSLVLLAARRQPVMPWLACIGLPLLPYVFSHAAIRYTFPTYFVFIALIAAGADQLTMRQEANQLRTF